MSWQGSTHQLVVWIQPLGTKLGILIPSANRREGTTEKMPWFVWENGAGVKYVRLLKEFTESCFPPVDFAIEHRIILATGAFFIVDGCGKILILLFK